MWFDYLAGQILCILSVYSLSTPTALPRLLMTHHMPGKVALPHAEVCHGCCDPRHLGHIRPLEQAAIKVHNERWLLDELEAFTYIYNPTTRSVKYAAPDGLHDDGVISLALAWHCRKAYSKRGQYKVMRV